MSEKITALLAAGRSIDAIKMINDGLPLIEAKHLIERVIALEAALRPFANMLPHVADKDIEPDAPLRIRREKSGAPDLYGRDIVRARTALRDK